MSGFSYLKTILPRCSSDKKELQSSHTTYIFGR